MPFILLVFLSAFLLEGIGTYISVVGLASLFAGSAVITILAVALDIAKIVSVSFVYNHWSKINWGMKTYMPIALAVLMLITSGGAASYLSGEFQKAIADTGVQAVKITALEEEQVRLQKRKEEIDAQIAKLPDNAVRGRTQLMKQFGPEISRLNDRLAIIDKELPELKVQNIDKEVHVGPIITIAKTFETTPEVAVKYVILTIIFVFDPLAVSLLIAGNFLLAQRKKLREETAQQTNEDLSYEPHNNEDLRELLVQASNNQPEPTPEPEQFAELEQDEEPKVDLELVPMELPVMEEVSSSLNVEIPAPPVKQMKRNIRIQRKNDRDEITLAGPEALPTSLDGVDANTADLTFISDGGLQADRLRSHYNKTIV